MEDADISPILAWKEDGVCPYGPKVWASSPAKRHYWLYWETLSLQDDILYRKFTKRDGTRTLNQLVIPQKLQWFIMHSLHGTLLSGHLGRWHTQDLVLQNYYWFEVSQDVDIYIKTCDTYAAVKPPVNKPKAALGPMPVGAPLD